MQIHKCERPNGAFFFIHTIMKPLQETNFFLIDGAWRDAYGNILADVLAKYGLLIDDRTQFARIYDYERMIIFYFRASAGKITLTLWRIEKL